MRSMDSSKCPCSKDVAPQVCEITNCHLIRSIRRNLETVLKARVATQTGCKIWKEVYIPHQATSFIENLSGRIGQNPPNMPICELS